MSKVVNKEGIRPGVIHRIALENFVTYKQVVLFPGPSLNMIVGPNGTGKSTFVCAIILGLCGKTSVIGRAKKISEYVRSGCEQASIEIELYQAPGQRNVIITRNFNLQDVSTWCIDSKMCEKKKLWLEYQELRERVIEYTNDKKKAVKLVNTHKSKMDPLQKLIDKAKSGINTRVKMEMAEITKALSKTNAAMDVLKKQKLEDVDNKRLEVLRNYSEDAYKAVMWLRQNKDMFQEPVYEPMVLEVLRNYSEDAYKAVMWLRQNKDMFQEPVYEPMMLEVLRNYSEDAYKAVMWLRQNKDMFQEPVYEPMMLE
ncbi:putative structural maintenance of chromosomes 5 smc5, partial [Operophtera brumata]